MHILIFHIDIQYFLNYQLKTYHPFSNSYSEQRNKTRVTLDVDLKTFPNMNMMELRCWAFKISVLGPLFNLLDNLEDRFHHQLHFTDENLTQHQRQGKWQHWIQTRLATRANSPSLEASQARTSSLTPQTCLHEIWPFLTTSITVSPVQVTFSWLYHLIGPLTCTCMPVVRYLSNPYKACNRSCHSSAQDPTVAPFHSELN